MGGAVAIGRMPGEIGTLGSLAALAAGHRSGVEQAQVLVPGGCVAGEFGDDRSYQDTGGADAFVVAGLGGHVGEHLTQVGSGMAYPSGLGIELHQLLGDDQAQ